MIDNQPDVNIPSIHFIQNSNITSDNGPLRTALRYVSRILYHRERLMNEIKKLKKFIDFEKEDLINQNKKLTEIVERFNNIVKKDYI